MPITAKGDTPNTALIEYMRDLESKIVEMETRLEALEAPEPIEDIDGGAP